MRNTENSFALALLAGSESNKSSYEAFLEMVSELDLQLLGIEAC